MDIKKHAFLGKIKVDHSIWMYVTGGRRKYKAGVKPRKITTGLLDHIKKFGLYPEGSGEPLNILNRKKRFPCNTTPIILGTNPDIP